MISRAAAAAAIAAMLALPALAEMIKFTGTGAPSDFEFGRTGSGAPGAWTIVRDDSADGGLALEQQSQDRTDYRFPLAIYKAVSAKNVDVQVRFKAMSGNVDRAGGIAVRLSGPNDYYVVRANALEDNVRFYRVVKGNREQLGTANVKVPSNEWSILGLRAERDRFSISFNGKPLYAVTDRTFDTAGKVALWTKADSVTRFDRLEINAMPQ